MSLSRSYLRRMALPQSSLLGSFSSPRNTIRFLQPIQSRAQTTATRPCQNPAPTRQRPQTLPNFRKQQFRPESSLAVSGDAAQKPVQDLQPIYQLTFTCKPCGHRSAHRVTKQGYHHGTVLIQCPGCHNRHVIADHLKVFLDQKSTLDDILRKKTEDGTPITNLIKKGKLGIRQDSMVGNEGEEDIEFWEDGTETKHEKPEAQNEAISPATFHAP